MKIVNLLNRVIGNHGRRLKKADEYMYWSPFTSHHKPKLQINTQTQKWHCWVSNQGGHNLFQLFKKLKASKEHFDELVELVGDRKYTKRNVKEDKKIVRLPNEFKPLWKNGSSIIKKHSIVYLANRNIKMADIIRYGIGYCEEGVYSNRVIIPSYSSNGELNYFVGRAYYEDDSFKHKNPQVSKDIVGFELHINWDMPIVLVEGAFDAIAIKRNAIPLLGKNIQNNLMKKLVTSLVNKIYIALDRDAIKQALKFCEMLMAEGKEVYLVDLQDKDPSEMGFSSFTKLIQKTQPLTYSNLMEKKLAI